jgi:hypothetical protein
MRWQTIVPEDAVDSLDAEQVLVSEQALYTSNGHTLHEIRLPEGGYRQVTSDEDHELLPLLAQDGTLVALAERTRGTRQHSLQGIDINTGALLWEFRPVAQELDDTGSSMASKDGVWSVGFSVGDVVILEVFSDPEVIEFTALEPADGLVSSQQTLDLGDGGSSYWISVVGWNGESVYLDLGGRLQVVDWVAGKETAAWP